MNKLRQAVAVMMLFGSLSVAGPARAGIPVIDVANLTQAIQQVLAWAQQYQQMMQQIGQMQAAYNAITGGRGMEALLPMTNLARNYLPPDYSEMLNVMNNASVTYSALASQVQGIVNSNAVLSPAQIGALSSQAQQAINQGRQAAAMLEMMTRQAQQTSSQRFGSMQGLISAIGGASDDKAIQDLQGRIAAEQAMLINEQTKLQAMYQMAQAQELRRQQQEREKAASSVGVEIALAFP